MEMMCRYHALQSAQEKNILYSNCYKKQSRESENKNLHICTSIEITFVK